MNILASRSPVAPFRHVDGVSRRFKAEPSKLNRLAGRVMVASGAFSTRAAPARSPLHGYAGALALLLVVGAAYLATSQRPAALSAIAVHPTQPDELLTLGVGHYRPPPAAEAPRVEGHDGFEVARWFRLAARE